MSPDHTDTFPGRPDRCYAFDSATPLSMVRKHQCCQLCGRLGQTDQTNLMLFCKHRTADPDNHERIGLRFDNREIPNGRLVVGLRKNPARCQPDLAVTLETPLYFLVDVARDTDTKTMQRGRLGSTTNLKTLGQLVSAQVDLDLDLCGKTRGLIAHVNQQFRWKAFGGHEHCSGARIDEFPVRWE